MYSFYNSHDFYFYLSHSERLNVDECLTHKWIKSIPIENGSDTSPTSTEKNISPGSIEHENCIAACDRANENGRSSTPTLCRHVVVSLSQSTNGSSPTISNGKNNGHNISSNGSTDEKLNDKENLHCTPLRTNAHSNILSPSVEASVLFPDAPTTPKVIRKASPLYSNLRKTAAVSVTNNADEISSYGTSPIVTIVVQQPLSAETLFDDQQQLVLNNRNTNGCQQRICSPD